MKSSWQENQKGKIVLEEIYDLPRTRKNVRNFKLW
jgi:hypothetical protein